VGFKPMILDCQVFYHCAAGEQPVACTVNILQSSFDVQTVLSMSLSLTLSFSVHLLESQVMLQIVASLTTTL
jgi:hypothetical protein